MTCLYFRRITSNVENMRKLIYRRENKYVRQPSLSELEQGRSDNKVAVYAIMDKHMKEQRFQSKICDLVSDSLGVLANDADSGGAMTASYALECQVEMQNKERTRFASYVEIKVFSKLSTTTWEDNLVVSWESLSKFFQFFGHRFDPI
jgi:hypothetical protein